MRTTDGFPAPDRDMAQVAPDVPPASREVSTLTSSIGGMLSIIMGLAAAVFGLVGVFSENGAGRIAALLVIAASVCFVLAGIAIARRATALPLVCLVLGVLLGIGSRLVG